MHVQIQTATANRSRGFTMTELMITLAIGAILAAVAIPNFQGYVGNSRIVAQTNEIIATVNRARSEAMKRNELVVVCPAEIDTNDATGSKCVFDPATQYTNGWISFVNERQDPDAFELPDAEAYDEGNDYQQLLMTYKGQPAGNLRILANQYGRNYFGFAPDGSLRSYDAAGNSVAVTDLIGDAVSIAVCDDRGEDFGRLIQVLHTGRTRIIRPDDGGVDCSP